MTNEEIESRKDADKMLADMILTDMEKELLDGINEAIAQDLKSFVEACEKEEYKKKRKLFYDTKKSIKKILS